MNTKQDELRAHAARLTKPNEQWLAELMRQAAAEIDVWRSEAKKWEGAFDEIQKPLLFEIARDGIGETETWGQCVERVVKERDALKKERDELVRQTINHSVSWGIESTHYRTIIAKKDACLNDCKIWLYTELGVPNWRLDKIKEALALKP